MSGSRAPHVTAIVDIKDEFTKPLKAFEEQLEKVANVADGALGGKASAAVAKLEDRLLKLGITVIDVGEEIKKAFGTTFTAEINKADLSLNKVGVTAIEVGDEVKKAFGQNSFKTFNAEAKEAAKVMYDASGGAASLRSNLKTANAELDRMSGDATKTFRALDVQIEKTGATLKESLSPAAMEPFVAETAKASASMKEMMVNASGVTKEIALAVTETGKFASETRSAEQAMRRTRDHSHEVRQSILDASDALKMMAGLEVGKMTTEAVHGGAELNQVRDAEIPALGISSESREHMVKGARDIAARNIMTTEREALQTAAEIRGELIISKEEAKGLSEHEREIALTKRAVLFAGYAADANKALIASGDTNGFGTTELKNLIKFTEASGNADHPEFLQRLLESYVKTKQVDRSFIDSGAFFTYITNAKAAGLSLSDNFLIDKLPVMLAMGKADRLGNETAQTLKSLSGGNVLKGTAEWLVQMGLADPKQLEKVGPGAVRIKGGVKDSALLNADPYAWAISTLMPALQAHGLTKPEDIKKALSAVGIDDEKASKIATAQNISASGLRATVADLLTHLIENSEVIEKNIEKKNAAMGLDAQGLVNTNAVAAMREFTQSFRNFTDVLGSASMPAAAKTLDSVAHVMSGWTKVMGEAFEKNPEMGARISQDAIGVAAYGTAKLLTGITLAGPKLQTAAEMQMEAARALSAAAHGTPIPGSPLTGNPGAQTPGSKTPLALPGPLQSYLLYELGTMAIDWLLPQTKGGQEWSGLSMWGKLQKTYNDFQNDPFWKPVWAKQQKPDSTYNRSLNPLDDGLVDPMIQERTTVNPASAPKPTPTIKMGAIPADKWGVMDDPIGYGLRALVNTVTEAFHKENSLKKDTAEPIKVESKTEVTGKAEVIVRVQADGLARPTTVTVPLSDTSKLGVTNAAASRRDE